MRIVIAVLVLISFMLAVHGAAPKGRKPPDAFPQIKELPNPFTFIDGSQVRTPQDWSKRRLELRQLFEDYEYGHMPPKPQRMTVKRGERLLDEASKVTIEDLELNFEHDGNTLTLNLRLVLPADAKSKLPVLIQSKFLFGGVKAEAKPSGKRYTTFTNQGYAVAELSFTQVAADKKETARSTGIYKLFGENIDCGALMAWAWGVGRVIDALESIPEIDISKIIVTGHSRYGKAALLAGAFDARIALTVPSHSGTAGCSPYRFIYGKSEELHNIVGAFPHWFRPDFKQFVGKVERLPVDQHLLMALVAPRALLNTEGTLDTWINPEGAQLTYGAAKKVYAFLKAEDKISIRYRPVGHIPSNEDLLAYANHIFFATVLPEEFGRLAYKEAVKGYTWDVPK